MRATPENWMYPPAEGWTYDQVKDLALPRDWELLGAKIAVRGRTSWWHDQVRDGIYYSLRNAKREPFTVNIERSTMIDESHAPTPDVVVFDKRGLDLRTLDCTPAGKAVLAVEVVSPGSRAEDHYYKHALYGYAKIDHYWRVERGEDDLPVVHEFWQHQEVNWYIPRPERPTHTGTLKTEVPFPIEIDLRSLIEV
ncbi:Uma2 family endonuclease [Streptomyces abikoensis]|uniref:Uma2 family endonuclease n=1 Tax=Streptomyces abikoensis TaxID=97398 RepID=UPI0036B32F46